MIPLADTKMLKRKRRPGPKAREHSHFAFVKAMLLSATQKRLQNGVTTAASFGVDGHEVTLSEELVRQKPSLAQSGEWNVTEKVKWATRPANAPSAGTIRVCWQCPESSALSK